MAKNSIRHCKITLLLGVALISANALADVAHVEVFPFQTSTLSDEQFLTTGIGSEDTIAGVLRLPFKPASVDKLPAVILMHGSNGYAGYVDDWVQRFNAMGIATLVPDSMAGRDLAGGVGASQASLGRLATSKDAYRALEILTEDARIDPERIVLMGFSRGGQAALYAGLTRFEKLHLQGEGSFAAIIALYPNCSYRYLQDETMADIPIRIFHGEADDYNPIAACEAYVERLRAANTDIEITGYPNAYHVFDWKGLPESLFSPNAQSTRDCDIAETEPGILTNMETGRPFSYSDECVRTGITVGHNAAAAAQVERAVSTFLNQALALPQP
jgi:dienelactone hydrolase